MEFKSDDDKLRYAFVVIPKALMTTDHAKHSCKKLYKPSTTHNTINRSHIRIRSCDEIIAIVSDAILWIMDILVNLLLYIYGM